VPILQFKNRGFYRTIAPVGNWTGWYFSEELYNALNYGYSYKILRGYTFKKENIFKEFIDFLYDLKEKKVLKEQLIILLLKY
jgi:hypothetical protein